MAEPSSRTTGSPGHPGRPRSPGPRSRRSRQDRPGRRSRHGRPDHPGLSRAKRALDLAGASALLLLLAPLLAALAVAVATGSRGPVLAPARRAGLGGRPFTMLRFRAAPATRTGRLLHRHFLEHLPQLINVVRGEMSLVGPRPLAPATAAAADGARARAAVRPGITGPWQTGGRSELPWEEMAVLDLHYAQECWLGLDLLLLARTPGAVLRGRAPGLAALPRARPGPRGRGRVA
ncbi:sugar transferase [Streptomyces sp. NPDC001985]|uniref:sugar transferase n=1 Tax=Streptomyces sp. NPDC001985 TaxID=3154406 RepID=UPI00332FC294